MEGLISEPTINWRQDVYGQSCCFFFFQATGSLSVQLRPSNTRSQQREWVKRRVRGRGGRIAESRQSLFLGGKRNVFSTPQKKKNQIKEQLLFSMESWSAIQRQSFLLPLAEESSRAISQQVLENKVFFLSRSLVRALSFHKDAHTWRRLNLPPPRCLTPVFIFLIHLFVSAIAGKGDGRLRVGQ